MPILLVKKYRDSLVHIETEQIVKAIESLQQESNPLKDYIFPIASAFFTSMLGAGIAYFSLRNQENIQIEKEKMNNTNKWTFALEKAKATLISIKVNYYSELTDNPIQRLSVMPSILFNSEPINEKLEQLSFIIKKADENVEPAKWSRILRIRAMVNNYNHLIDLWNQRNAIERPIKEKLVDQNSAQGYVDMSEQEVIKAIGASKMVVLIDLTERVIRLTDDMLIEINDFLINFPLYAKSKIKTKRLKRFGSVITYSVNDNKLLLAMLARTPKPNFSSVENLFGETSEEIERKMKTGYE
jgi:hypothetical protein